MIVQKHTAFKRGYISRKHPEGIKKEYDGKYGKGYTIETPCFHSTRYHYITYFIEENE